MNYNIDSSIFQFEQQEDVHLHVHDDDDHEPMIHFSSQLPAAYQDHVFITSNSHIPVGAPPCSIISAEKCQESKKKLRPRATILETDELINPNEVKKKKVLHKEVERQRRLEMTTLYNLLRSHLPLEHLKGKRSISDHMHEAVNYIKLMKKKIEELEDKKDDGGLTIISKCNYSTHKKVLNLDSTASFCSRDDHEFFLSVKHCLVGVEVVISIDLKRERLQLSKVLEIIIGEGLDIVNCMSTKANDKFVYTIQSEVNDGRRICTLSDLKRKLENLLIE